MQMLIYNSATTSTNYCNIVENGINVYTTALQYWNIVENGTNVQCMSKSEFYSSDSVL